MRIYIISVVSLLAMLITAPARAQTPSMLDPPTTQIAMGTSHTCALTTTGGVQCWGSNDQGQLGNGTTTDSSTPVAVSGLASGVAAITAGAYYTCALTTLGAVKCWGYNGNGQLGNGTTTTSSTPVVSGLSSGVVAISTGVAHTCALTTAGGVKCWGSNLFAQLGDGTTTDSSTPVAVSGLSNGVMAIAAGYDHTCALTTTGAVQCWGYNSNGQLGNGTTTDSASPVPVSGLSSGVMAIATSYSHTCALTTAGAVKCWGYNGQGQLGDNTTTDSSTPVMVLGLGSGVAAVTGGWYHSCALTTAGGVKCWGYNGQGQFGNGTTSDSSTPVTVLDSNFLPLNSIAAIAAGTYNTCALTTLGGIKCWGYNGNGQLGNGTTTDSSAPVDVSGHSGGVVALAAGGNFSCALTSAGAAKCWGNNDTGQLGNGQLGIGENSIPVAVAGLFSGVAAIAAGYADACALTTAGGMKCWGGNESGELGNGTTTNSTTPVAVSGLSSGVMAIATSSFHTCALTTLGAVKCWGYNGYGQLGDGTTTDSSTPVDVSGLASGVEAIAAGIDHTCALTMAGAVMCWGNNEAGQLGNGTTTDSSSPVLVSGLASGVTAIAAGGSRTCALMTTGGVKCWGSDYYGELGNGNSGSGAHSAVPVDVVGLASGVSAIAAGSIHTCALTTVGGVKCWGNNNHGELGTGNTDNSSTPVDVSNLGSGVTAIATGEFHNCAQILGGGVRCWGYNVNGQLGNSSTTDEHVPVSILAGQSITFAPSARMGVGNNVALFAAASGGDAVSFDTWTPSTCTLSGGKLELTDTGWCGVRASQGGSSDGMGGTIAAAPQQLRLIQVEADLIFANGYDTWGGLSH